MKISIVFFVQRINHTIPIDHFNGNILTNSFNFSCKINEKVKIQNQIIFSIFPTLSRESYQKLFQNEPLGAQNALLF